ncbi:MAG TPA: helix-turn-helix domain-containing protein [Blastocatellia bacterium]|nr:helix-turn-helix domain-containing protein [Blastocatellia bacterium]
MKDTETVKGRAAEQLFGVYKKLAETGRVGLTEKELCEVLGICRLTALRSRQSGKLRYCKLTATKLLYLPEHIEEFLKSCERRDTSRRNRRKLDMY